MDLPRPGKPDEKPSAVVDNCFLICIFPGSTRLDCIQLHGKTETTGPDCARIPFEYLMKESTTRHNEPYEYGSFYCHDEDRDTDWSQSDEEEEDEDVIKYLKKYDHEDFYQYPGPVSAKDMFRIDTNCSDEIHCVHFIDCIDIKSPKFGQICCYQVDSSSPWILSLLISYSPDRFVFCPFQDFHPFTKQSTDDLFCMDDHLLPPVVIRNDKVFDGVTKVMYMNQVSGNKPYCTDPPSQQFKDVWDQKSSFIKSSPNGQDLLPFRKLTKGIWLRMCYKSFHCSNPEPVEEMKV